MTGPEFMIIGAARSGTTGLAQGLRSHRGIFVTEPKEPHYFAFHGKRPDFRGPGDERRVNQRAVVEWDRYLSLYDGAPAGAVTGEASVTSLYFHQAAIPEIASRVADPRLVVILREPVSRAFSAFEYQRALDVEPCETFLSALAEEDARVAADWQHLWHYRGMSLYAEPLAAFQQAFGRDRVGVWFHDDLEGDYERTLTEILQFVGVLDVGSVAGPVRVNAGGQSRNAVLSGLANRARSVGPVRRAARSLTSYRFREVIRQRMLKRSQLTAEEHATVGPLFAEDLRALRPLLTTERLPGWLTGVQA